MSTAVLEARGVTAGWGKRPLLQGLTLQVGAGERVAVLGPNGAGKTTLFDVLAGRLPPRQGHVLLLGQEVTKQRLHQRARRGLGYVPQEPTVFDSLTVQENLAAALRAPARRPASSDLADADILEASLRRFSLSSVATQPARTLSGGERRRVEVARTLLLRPGVLLLDEPFAGLDPRGRKALQSGLERLPPRTALVMTDHAADDLLALCERVVLLIDGGIVFDGPRSDFSPASEAWARYFGP
ncbi:MAG: ATP-binding cassette domain-containing protein [Deltaproteobacteria bacterium]|nr:ATP-binding cassette domain-containing protein [Deltaproteobacteria bacterium]